jgi:hypothetical protein
MTCKINADTSDGLKIASDTSGAVDIQRNGSTIVTVDTRLKANSIKVYSAFGTQTATSTDTFNFTVGAMTKAITPISADSLFYITWQSMWQFDINELGAGARVNMTHIVDGTTNNSTTPSTTNHDFWGGDNYDGHGIRHPILTHTYTVQPNTTNEVTFGYRWLAYGNGAQGPYAWQRFSILEITDATLDIG